MNLVLQKLSGGQRWATAKVAAVVAVAVGAASSAMAQTDPFVTAAASVTEKVESYGGTLVGVAAVAIVFYIAIKFLKKLPSAA